MKRGALIKEYGELSTIEEVEKEIAEKVDANFEEYQRPIEAFVTFKT